MLLCLLAPGCFALVQGQTSTVSFSSKPTGARFTFGSVGGVTPCTLEVPRSGDPCMIRFELDGADPVVDEVAPGGWHGVLPGFALGFDIVASIALFPLSFPIVIDLVSDAFDEWPASIRAELRPAGQPGGFVWKDRGR